MKHFTLNEFECQCGCGEKPMQPSFLNAIDKARDAAGVPFVITSGYRCAEHNAAVGGVENSAHVKGCAADIACSSSTQRFAIICGLLTAGFSRIGIADGFVHCDNDKNKPEGVIWTY